MRITIEQPQLLKGLHTIERAVNDRSALPILANVLVEVKDQALILTATDLDVGIRCQLPLTESSEPGAATVPARRFSTIVRELPEDPITLETKNNHTTILTCSASRFRIPGLPAEDFPIFPPIESTNNLTIPQPTLKTLIDQTAFAMSIEETRFILNGALLKTTPQGIQLVATDGRRLALASAQPSTGAVECAVVVPSKTIRELGRLLQEDDDEPVVMTPLRDNQLVFQFGAVTVISRLIEGQFPPYEGVVPAPSPAALTCSRALLMSAIRRASLMTTATSQAVVFELAKERLVVSKESPDLGSAREEVPATYTGEPMTIAFNPEFWLDVLKILDEEAATIEVVSPDKPAVIRLPRPNSLGPRSSGSEPEKLGRGLPRFLYLVLPMKLA